MRRIVEIIVFALVFALAGQSATAQVDRHDVRAGNRKFVKQNYRGADVDYRKALLKDSTSFAANFNLANNLYRQENWDEASSYYAKMKDVAPSTPYASDYSYNAGNAAVQKKDWQAAVDSYKQSLLLNPNDLDAKENYIYAKKMLENQQNGGGGDNNQNQDQNQDNQDQNQDQNQNDQNQDQQQNNQNQNQDQNQGNQDQQQQQQPKISPQQAQQMLQAIQAKEKETQDKVNKEKAAALQSRQKEKNW